MAARRSQVLSRRFILADGEEQICIRKWRETINDEVCVCVFDDVIDCYTLDDVNKKWNNNQWEERENVYNRCRIRAHVPLSVCGRVAETTTDAAATNRSN